MTMLESNTGPSAPEPSPQAAVVPSRPDATAALKSISAWLSGIRSRAWGMLIAQRIGILLAAGIVAVIAGGTLDYFLRAPIWLRGIGLFAALSFFAWVIWHWLLPALRFGPSLSEIALRVERSEAGKAANLPGVLASAVELGNARTGNGSTSDVLTAPVIHAAADRLKSVSTHQIFAPSSTLRGIATGTALVLALIGLSIVLPSHTRIGLSRMLLPWAGAEWPKRSEIADATQRAHHPLGSALPLRAALVRSERAVEDVRIAAVYRIIENGVPGPERRALLTPQAGDVDVVSRGQIASGRLFERLLDPLALSPTTSTTAPGSAHPSTTDARTIELEYVLQSRDDQTDPARITLVEPPLVLKASASVVTPAYAAALLGAPVDGGPKTIDLGSGIDERSAPPPLLMGSRVQVTLEFNKALPMPPSALRSSTAELDASSASWLANTLGSDALVLFSRASSAAKATDDTEPALTDLPSTGATLTSDPTGRVWTLSWQHWEAVRLLVKPSDQYQITADQDAVFRLDILKDNPPTASVTLPIEDKSVLPTAVVELSGEARDDVALASVKLSRQLATRPPSEGGQVVQAVELQGERIDLIIAKAVPDAPGPDGKPAAGTKRLTTSFTLDLSTIPDLKPGDEVWITAVATDAFELDGRTHAPVLSTPRKLRMLSRQQLVEQVWSELSSTRRTAIRLDQDQAEAMKNQPPTGPDGAQASSRQERAQAGLTERLARQTQSLDRLRDRVRENNLVDQDLTQMLDRARAALEQAGQESTQATKQLGEAAQEQAQEAAAKDAGKAPLDQAKADQQQVRDQLAELANMLDQGEDTFASTRAVERLMEQQQSLQQQTAEAGRDTAGKRPDQLSPEQRQSLEQIAQQQQALSEQLKDALRQMAEREKKLSKSDPAAAQAMNQAQKQAQRDQTAERMQQAAEDARENQTGGAQQQQQQAMQSMQQMLNQLRQAQNNRDEVLRRYLASLMDSLVNLAARQTAEIENLQAAQAAQVPSLEPAMVQLHQNTLGVLDESSKGPREAAPITEQIDVAAEKMAESIPELRASAQDVALAKEQAALDALRKAIELAQKLDQQAEDRQEQRKRTELKQQYQELLTRQLALRDNAKELASAEQNRRTKAAARLLANDQSTLKDDLTKVRATVAEIKDRKVFDFAHDRLNSLMTSSSESLAAGNATPSVVSQQTSAARLLESLVSALDNAQRPDRPFREAEGQQAGGSGGSSGGGMIPPAAELKLLKLMQQEALDLTKAASDAPQASGVSLPDAAKLQQDLAQQAQDLLRRMTESASKGARPVPIKTPDPAPKDDLPKPEMPGEIPQQNDDAREAPAPPSNGAPRP